MHTYSASDSNFGSKLGLVDLRLGFALAFFLAAATSTALAEVPSGSRAEAEVYFRNLATKLDYSTPKDIGNTTLTDLAAYLGYEKLTAEKLEFDLPETLMADGKTKGDVIVSRFFAPKIMNVKSKEGTPEFKLGWRKLVRLNAQEGSKAHANHIASAVILFNTFTSPNEEPFGSSNFSVNTQVMLLPEADFIEPLPLQEGNGTMDTVYWLDYQKATAAGPGKLGYALEASFDANELPGAGTKEYFVPDGCVACHGITKKRSLLNFLDTDHWFDRLDTDFPQLKASDRALLFDAGTNDPAQQKFKDAIGLIRTFNEEAHQHASRAQPTHDESLAAAKWLEIHKTNDARVLPVQRAIGAAPFWQAGNEDEVAVLTTMNQYCYRCHGTVKFSVFNKDSMLKAENRAKFLLRLDPDAEKGLKMPPDRDLPDKERQQLLDFFK